MAKPAYEIKQLEPSNFDSRLVERHLGEGRLNAKELQKHLDGLDDLADKGEEFEVVLGDDPEAESQGE